MITHPVPGAALSCQYIVLAYADVSSRKLTCTRVEKCDVMLPWQHYFWMTTKPTTTATAGRTAKNNMFILTNNNFARTSRYFVHFFASLHHYDMKLLNFTSPLYGGEHNTKNCRFLFLNLDNDKYGLEENFAKICQIKLNKIE